VAYRDLAEQRALSCATDSRTSPRTILQSRFPPPPCVCAAVTSTLTELAADEPAAFAQLMVYVAVPLAAGETACVPEEGNAPLQFPEAVQPVVFTELQVRVIEPPAAIEAADDEIVGVPGGIKAMAASA
jgi:hypothetical protein